jgi:S1-C subfamily serine protease
MRGRIFPLAAIAAIAVVGTALFFFTPVFGFTQVRSTAAAKTGQESDTAPLAAPPTILELPINNALGPIHDFIAKGKVEYGWLGAQIADIQDKETYPGFAADLKLDGVKGALVMEIYKGSPADQAGLLPGDYVTQVDKAVITDAAKLTQVVGGLAAGHTSTFSLVRYGENITVPVKIGVRDDNDQVAQAKKLWPGLTVIDIKDQVRQQVDIPRGTRGVVVGYVPDQDAPASIAGLKPGDVITSVNGTSVRNMMDYYRALNTGSGRSVMFTIERDGTEITIGLDR